MQAVKASDISLCCSIRSTAPCLDTMTSQCSLSLTRIARTTGRCSAESMFQPRSDALTKLAVPSAGLVGLVSRSFQQNRYLLKDLYHSRCSSCTGYPKHTTFLKTPNPMLCGRSQPYRVPAQTQALGVLGLTSYVLKTPLSLSTDLPSNVLLGTSISRC